MKSTTEFGRFSDVFPLVAPATRNDISNIDSHQVGSCDLHSGLISLQEAHIATLKDSRGSANSKDPWGPLWGAPKYPMGAIGARCGKKVSLKGGSK